MHIGVTGANGFIGHHLVRALVARGDRPAALLQRGTDPRPLSDLEERYDAHWGDVLDRPSIDRFVAGCDAVIHLAGINRYWAADPGVFARVNVDGARNVAEACLARGVGRLVHASSCITLGASDGPVARDETSPFNLGRLHFAYAETKRAGEALVLGLARERGLPAVVVHPTSAVGELDHGPTPIGKPIADIARGLWPVWVGGGACFIDVHDLVRGFLLALERGVPGRQYLLAGENLTNRGFMSLVAEVAGAPRPRVRLPRALLAGAAGALEWAADRVTHRPPPLTRSMAALVDRYLWFDGRRAREELGFEAGPVRGAIARAVGWFRQREGG